MRETLAQVIERAARNSVPWPEREDHCVDWDKDEYRASTLSEFVENTYIGEDGAKDCFAAASKAAALEVLKHLREPTDLMGCGLPADYKPGSHSATQIWRAMIDAAIKEEADNA